MCQCYTYHDIMMNKYSLVHRAQSHGRAILPVNTRRLMAREATQQTNLPSLTFSSVLYITSPVSNYTAQCPNNGALYNVYHQALLIILDNTWF